MYEKFLAKIEQWKEKGIPLMFVRDPLTKLPSVSLTLLLISALLVIIGLVGKWAKVVDGIDLDNSLELLMISASLYFGRAISKKVNQ